MNVTTSRNKLDVNSIVILSQFVFLLFLLYYREDHDVNIIYMLIYIYEVSFEDSKYINIMCDNLFNKLGIKNK